MMSKYRVTPRGKVVFSITGIIALVLLFMFVQSLLPDQDAPVEPVNNTNNIEEMNTDSDQNDMDSTSEDFIKDEPDEESSTEGETTVSNEDEMNGQDTSNEDAMQDTSLDVETLMNAKSTVYFEPDQYDLNDEYKLILNIFIGIAKDYPEEMIIVEGNINGYPKFNDSKFGEELSQIRADKVAQYLKNMGIAEHVIKVMSNGSSKPLNKSDSAEELMLNRRTDVYFEAYKLEEDSSK